MVEELPLKTTIEDILYCFSGQRCLGMEREYPTSAVQMSPKALLQQKHRYLAPTRSPPERAAPLSPDSPRQGLWTGVNFELKKPLVTVLESVGYCRKLT